MGGEDYQHMITTVAIAVEVAAGEFQSGLIIGVGPF